MNKKTIHDLGFDTGVTYKASEDALVIYDTRAHTPKSMVVLSSDQMHELAKYWFDGYCPICFAAIVMNDIVCDDCLKQALSVRL